MKTSYNWLKEYVETPWSPQELAARLTMAGLEVESIETIGDFPDSIVVAEIVSRTQHPNADRLSVCEVNDGSNGGVSVVCGAPNCDAGRKAILAHVGTILPNGMELTKAKIRGESSYGMLCSERELEIGDDHTGIMILPEDAVIGMPLREYMGTDTVIDWEVTPNRPDWLSHLGIAREIAALTGTGLRLPDIELPEADPTAIDKEFSIEVADPDLCPRYIGRLIKDVRIGPSPEWMQKYLRAVGLRPISSVVDITNFVLMECGQPLHAFDCRKLAGCRLIIRRAVDAETIRTLDGQEHGLSRDNLLIADSDGGVALAGVMGGENSEIEDSTQTVLLESAAFDARNIRMTSKRLGLSTDSSYRFERGTDVEMVEFASARAAKLICQLAGGTLASGKFDVRTAAYHAPEVVCRYDRVARMLGVAIEPDRVRAILSNLGMTIKTAGGDKCVAAIPSFRLDLTREADLIEEVARVHGLDTIPSSMSASILGGERTDDAYYADERVRNELIELGLFECMSQSLTGAREAATGTGFDSDELIPLENPLSTEVAVMRPSLLSGMLRTVAHNIAHGNSDLALFELGRVYCHSDAYTEERQEACIALTGRRHPERYSDEKTEVYQFCDLRGLLEDWMARRRTGSYVIRPTEHPALRPGICAELAVNGKSAAVFGCIADTLVADMRIANPLFLALVQIDVLWASESEPSRYRSLPQFPATNRDVSFVTAEGLLHQQVLDVINGTRIDILEKTELFDVFRDDKTLGPNRKSMAYSLTFRSSERTLKDEEVNDAHEALKARLAQELPIEIR